jgi:5'-nucleotidase/UDP-sugar diphosphatase
MIFKFQYYTLIFFFGLTLSACGNSQKTQTTQPEDHEVSSDSIKSTTQAPDPEVKTLTVLYTNDEHGWMEGLDEGRGAAELAGLWKKNHSGSDGLLILSGGDNWTGPAISTWFEGEGMVETMNVMAYSASAIGNHEFDFGLDILEERILQANYPFLAANIRYKSNSSVPTDLGIQPYVILEIAGLKIGVIGLANVDTPSTTNPKIVADFEFHDYAETLREYVPEIWSAGVDMIFVPSHLCTWELAPLARDVKDIGITLFGGGHCHEEYSNLIEGSVILSGGSYLSSYSYATFEVDTADVEILDADFGVVDNIGGLPDPQIAEIIDYWHEAAAGELNIVIGYSDDEIPQRSDEMAALITNSWLFAYPADVALTNWGGMRDRIQSGEITISSIISVMPFDNVLVEVELTGEQLNQVLNFGNGLPPVGGVHWGMGHWVFDKTGEPLDPNIKYSLLVTDFLYAGGDDYYMLSEIDPGAYNTAISWRQPVIDWILAQDSDAENPIESIIE